MDREQMQRCLDVVAAYRASGQKGKAWAQANGVPERTLASWCAHARRWQARLDGVPPRAEAFTQLTQRLRGRSPGASRRCVGHGAHADSLWRHAARTVLAAGPCC